MCVVEISGVERMREQKGDCIRSFFNLSESVEYFVSVMGEITTVGFDFTLCDIE